MSNPLVPSAIRTIYQGRIFTVQVETVTLRKGGTLEAEIVRHPGSVVIVPVTDANEILLVRQYRHAIGRWAWELPAGSLKPKEDPDQAAARECEEEIGLVPGRLTRLRSYFPTPGFCDEEMIYYRCEDLRAPAADSTARKDDDEEIEPRTFTLAEARALIASGDIVDLKTVAGLSLL